MLPVEGFGIGVQLLSFGFQLMTDRQHKFAFQVQVELIKCLLQVPNMNELATEIMQMMIGLFPQRSPQELFEFMMNLFQAVGNDSLFFTLCKEFMISVINVLPQDPYLIAEQKEKVLSEAGEKFKAMSESDELSDSE
jgi:hypothetical protein